MHLIEMGPADRLRSVISGVSRFSIGTDAEPIVPRKSEKLPRSRVLGLISFAAFQR